MKHTNPQSLHVLSIQSTPLPRIAAARIMRRLALVACLSTSLLLGSAPADADAVNQPAGWGLGVMLGGPTGLTAKRWMGGANAFDIGLGFGGFGFNPGFRLHADFLWGLAQVLPDTTDITLDVYLGVGPVVGAGTHGRCGNYDRYNTYCESYIYAGGRVPLGIDLRFRNAPVQLGLEIAPGLVAGRNALSGLLDATLNARFLF